VYIFEPVLPVWEDEIQEDLRSLDKRILSAGRINNELLKAVGY
jgi:hypothetical protein